MAGERHGRGMGTACYVCESAFRCPLQLLGVVWDEILVDVLTLKLIRNETSVNIYHSKRRNMSEELSTLNYNLKYRAFKLHGCTVHQ
jgi:hypothetical protein